MLISFSSNTFQRDFERLYRARGREGGTPRNSWWGTLWRTDLQIVTLFQTKKFHFSHPFSDLASRKLCHHFLDSTPTKEISYSHISLSFLHIWKSNDKYVHTLP